MQDGRKQVARVLKNNSCSQQREGIRSGKEKAGGEKKKRGSLGSGEAKKRNQNLKGMRQATKLGMQLDQAKQDSKPLRGD